jgi:hypothetical protein
MSEGCENTMKSAATIQAAAIRQKESMSMHQRRAAEE